MPSRTINQYAIVSRHDVPSDVAAPEDFTLAPTSVRSSPNLPPHALAYCADFGAERVLFTHHDPARSQSLFAAPFLFVEQLRSASSVTAVPFERLAELGLVEAGMRPMMVFSPGRTGSTLLTKLLAAAGLGCASEPDMLTQIARTDTAVWADLPPDMDRLLAAACIGALCRVLGVGAAIKLRGWCNARPLAMVQGFPACRVLFMLRGMTGWVLSRHRVFGESADAVAAELLRALDALDTLAAEKIAVEILWYETLAVEPEAALARLGARVPALLLAQIMQQDAQEGSWIARRIVAGRPVQSGFMSEFAACWARCRQERFWSVGTEKLLQLMWDS